MLADARADGRSGALALSFVHKIGISHTKICQSELDWLKENQSFFLKTLTLTGIMEEISGAGN